MPTPWATLGMQAAGQAGGGIMGLLFDGISRKAQLKQAGKMQDLQIKGQQQMTDYNMQKQLEMWEKTGFQGQMKQLKAAGLSPGLIYGMGGAGGQTANVEAGNVTGQQSQQGQGGLMGMEIGSRMAERAMQLEIMKAQKANIEADTANKQSTNPNIPKQGAKLDAETQSILQGINNQKAQQALTEAQEYSINVISDINARSSNGQVAMILKHLERETEEVAKILRENQIGDATIKEKIAQIKYESAGALLNNIQTQAETRNIDQDTRLKWQQVQETMSRMRLIYAQIDNMRKNVEIAQEANRLREQMNDLNDPNLTPQIQSVISGLVGGILGGLGSKAARPGEVGGFHKRN